MAEFLSCVMMGLHSLSGGIKVPNFGEIVEVQHVLKRSWKSDGAQGGVKYWKPVEPKIKKGIFLGRRTLTNGRLVPEEDFIYRKTETFEAALVCFTERKNPEYCILNHNQFSCPYKV